MYLTLPPRNSESTQALPSHAVSMSSESKKEKEGLRRIISNYLASGGATSLDAREYSGTSRVDANKHALARVTRPRAERSTVPASARSSALGASEKIARDPLIRVDSVAEVAK